MVASEMKETVKRLDLIARQGGALGLPLAGGSSRQPDIRKESVAGLAPSSCLLESTQPISHLEAQSESSNMGAGIQKPTAPVSKSILITDQSGHWLEELEDAAELGIRNLTNVTSGEEAGRARLIERQYIETLELVWARDRKPNGRNGQLDYEVLESLQPHPNIKKLIIKEYYGSKFPSWIENQWLSKLETIELNGCRTWLFTSLGKLPSLKYLFIKDSPFQKHQESEGREAEEDSQLLFPSLCVLKISHCSNLERLPLLPPTLTELSIESLGLTALPGSSSPTSLKSIRISECFSLTSLRGGFLQLGTLEALTIAGCIYLESFPEDGLRLLVSLKSLNIECCRYLTWSPECGSCLPSSLVELKIVKCWRLCVDSFFSELRNLTSLSSLIIEGPELYNLPGELLSHLTALTELEIKDCPQLRTLGFEALVSLRRLKICWCKLQPAPSFGSLGPLLLEYLEIKYNNNLEFLTHELIQNMTSLQELRIMESPLDGRVCRLTSLRKLYIDRCGSLRSLADELGSLTKLEELCITGCHKLKSLPEKGLPASLIILGISNCGIPVDRYEKGGPDWCKIAHIPYVEIAGYQIETDAWKQELEGF